MLLDINAYVGHWPFQQFRYNTCDKLLERMNMFGVDISVISNLNGIFYKNVQSANEELYDEIRSDKRFSGRFIPFAVINPKYAGWRDDFDVCIEKMGMKGIRVYPKYHNYKITDPSLVELVKRTRDRNLPVAFNVRMVDSRGTSWLDIPFIYGSPTPEWTLKDIVPIVKAVPDAKFMILNVTMFNFTEVSKEDAEVLKNSNTVFDTSGRALKILSEYFDLVGKEKFAFGTHSPIFDYLTALLRVESLRDSEADEATKELIRSGNARRILGI